MNDLRQLRHFVALAEHGHFARAATAVNLSQPALSRSIQALESSLDCQLLERPSRGVSLTAHGQLVLEHARRLLAGSRALENAVSQLGNLQAGELHLGCGPYPAARLIPQTLGQFSGSFPKVRVQLLIDDWRNLRRRLLNDELELYVADIREYGADPQLCVIPLQQYPGVIFCRPGHPLLSKDPLELNASLAYPLAGTSLPTAINQTMQTLTGRAHPLTIECDNFMVLKALVSASDALSMAPWDVIAEEVLSGSLAVLDLPLERLAQSSAYGLVSRSGRSLSPAAQAFSTLLQEVDQHCAALLPAHRDQSNR
ncbi:MAG: LysR family transcriptional regulator [Pseudomonas sp.]|uniref:LysR family transcriptional regulator n=1 Tax=Pseudomonas sp. TaxID=306 RepID=UPI002732F3F5|nr:LysR family transcriptional regulator [Pseudomonas sp.]MDP3846526.1 LysR family transcriptional regulator [Pseudomonas sp.]